MCQSVTDWVRTVESTLLTIDNAYDSPAYESLRKAVNSFNVVVNNFRKAKTIDLSKFESKLKDSKPMAIVAPVRRQSQSSNVQITEI